MTGFQKTDFGVPSACRAGNTKIGFTMRIAEPKKIYCRNARTNFLWRCFAAPQKIDSLLHLGDVMTFDLCNFYHRDDCIDYGFMTTSI
jgi:hypothetical protein